VKLSAKQKNACLLLFEDRLSDDHIAEECGISRRTLTRWKQLPEVKEEIERLREAKRKEILKQVKTEGVADKANRLRALNKRWGKMLGIIEARATSALERMVEAQSEPPRGVTNRQWRLITGVAPGAETGLMVRQEKMLGGGEMAEKIVEWKIDIPMLRELRDIEKQAAIEVEEWAEKRVIDLSTLTIDQIAALLGAEAASGGEEAGGKD